MVEVIAEAVVAVAETVVAKENIKVATIKGAEALNVQ
jgi:hypothetical protein